jgi:sugar O-acyltransferase (sialic acid O-acetyltransferase NeuD family)
MIVAGAGGHAREIAGILAELGETNGVYLFDDISASAPEVIWGTFPVVREASAARKLLLQDARFILGVGKPAYRKALYEKLIDLGGAPYSVISPFAHVGRFNTILGDGLNIMTGAVITEDVVVGNGSLIHINASVHHDCRIGLFCELSPGCRLLGKVATGNCVSIGSNAVVLPGITIGDHAVIGAGAVVTKNVPAGTVVKGVPAK